MSSFMRHGLGDCTAENHCGCLTNAPIDHTAAIDQPYRIKFRRDLDALTGSPEATDALLAHANAAASERVERVVNDEHQQGVVMAGWLLTFPEVLAAVLPDLLAAAWDAGYTRGFYDRERLSPDMPGRDASEGATPNPYRRGTEGDPK